MIQVAIIRRRLKEGKTYEDFRRAWYHTVGFGTANRMLSVINVADPREVIVIGLNETTVEQVRRLIAIDVQQRQANPLDDIIEPEIDRTFGILVAEDDFSAGGDQTYQPAAVGGRELNMSELKMNLKEGAAILSELRDMGK
jgi:hypothetical protein